MKPVIYYAVRRSPHGFGGQFDVIAVTSTKNMRVFGRDATDTPINTTWRHVVFKHGEKATADAVCHAINEVYEQFSQPLREHDASRNELVNRRTQAINAVIAAAQEAQS